MFEQPLRQAWMCRELIKPPERLPFPGCPVQLLASSLALVHLTWDLNVRLGETQVPHSKASLGFAFHSQSIQAPLAVKLLVFMARKNALTSCCFHLKFQSVSQINNFQLVIYLWLMSRAMKLSFLTILSGPPPREICWLLHSSTAWKPLHLYEMMRCWVGWVIYHQLGFSLV